MGVIERFQRGWNAFINNRDPTFENHSNNIGIGYSLRPDRPRLSRGNERTIVSSIYNRIALDVASMEFKHTKLDENGRYTSDMNSGLNDCLTLEANIDQTNRAFIQDCVLSMLDEGHVAIVPVDTTVDPNDTSSYDINTLRTGKILEWYPRHVKVRVYDDRVGEKKDVILSKSIVGIIENPLYAVVNEPNSTAQRLIRKLRLLDIVDEQSSSGRLDLIIQLPYSTRAELRKEQASNRRQELEDQMSNSKLGIGYIDSSEKVIQLNRPVENNLLKQIEYLMNLFYSQIGITQSVMDGTADEKTMLNYYNRATEPIASAIADEMKRKFLSKTARTQGQSISVFRNPFKLVPVEQLAEIVDKFTRNEIASSNEFRQIIGWKPSKDPRADELRNKNISEPVNKETTMETKQELKKFMEENQNG